MTIAIARISNVRNAPLASALPVWATQSNPVIRYSS
jgi:hypothetical protein